MAGEVNGTHICSASLSFSAVRPSISAFCSDIASFNRLMLPKAFFSHASCSCAHQQAVTCQERGEGLLIKGCRRLIDPQECFTPHAKRLPEDMC